MNKKIIVMAIIVIFLLTGISSVSALENNKLIVKADGFNYYIESVTYAPEIIEKEELVIFTVTIGFENTEDAVYIELYVDEYCNPDEGMASAAIPDRPTVELEYTWPNDYEDHDVLIMVDPEDQDDEIDETDNAWEERLSAYETPDEEKPDFVITKIELEDYVEGYGYPVRLTINNRGASVEKMDVPIKLEIEDFGHPVEYDIEYEGTGIQTDPYAICIKVPKGLSTLIAEIDPPDEDHPNGQIEEWHSDGKAEENNIKTKSITRARDTISIFNILQNMLNKIDWPFPMLRLMLLALGK